MRELLLNGTGGDQMDDRAGQHGRLIWRCHTRISASRVSPVVNSLAVPIKG